jgi:hypothetical protein
MDENKELLTIMQSRRGELSYDGLARLIGIQTATLWRFYERQKGLGIKSIRLIAAWARENNDGELIQALTRYALGPQ